MESTEGAGARKRIHVLIVGAGCFGLSTAYHLLVDNESSTDLGAQGTTPWYKVTIIDASDVLPAPDAASTDLNKIVRTSYSDSWYTRFAKEAIAEWKEGTICGKDTYHESGVLVLGLRYQSTGDPDNGLTKPYADAGLRNDREINARIEDFPTPGMARRALPAGVVGGPLFDEGAAYLNRDGGWASASKAMEAILGNVKRLGGDVRTGCKLIGVSAQDDGTSIANLENGDVIHADMIVLSTGAWTPHVIGGIPQFESVLKDRLIATGQVVATLRPPPDYQQKFRETPVLLDWQSGFYMFPPNEEGVIKIAVHAEGHTFAPASSRDFSELKADSEPSRSNLDSVVSRPRTVRTHGEDDGTRVPRHSLQRIHSKLAGAYPELAKVSLETTRLCWYTESPDENWFIDQVPGHPTLFIASGGSGHAFKFLPVIGRLVKQRIEGRLRAEDTAKFALCREFGASFRSRLGQPVALDEDALWGAKEFNDYIIGGGGYETRVN